MTTLQRVPPAEIEARSFAIIEAEFSAQTGLDRAAIPEAHFRLMQRVIHATGDFSFAHLLRLHPEAVPAGLAAIRAGRDVLTDVEMVRAGIGASALRRWGGKVICRLNAPDIAGRAAKAGDTRTETAIKDGLAGDIGLVAIGNAPTALLTAIEIANQRLPAERPALIVGVPVGFVNASESKEILTGCGIPFITVEGRKGGSPVAAAIVNALLRLA